MIMMVVEYATRAAKVPIKQQRRQEPALPPRPFTHFSCVHFFPHRTYCYYFYFYCCCCYNYCYYYYYYYLLICPSTISSETGALTNVNKTELS